MGQECRGEHLKRYRPGSAHLVREGLTKRVLILQTELTLARVGCSKMTKPSLWIHVASCFHHVISSTHRLPLWRCLQDIPTKHWKDGATLSWAFRIKSVSKVDLFFWWSSQPWVFCSNKGKWTNRNTSLTGIQRERGLSTFFFYAETVTNPPTFIGNYVSETAVEDSGKREC